jgi:structure-specific recognition protein 1
MNDGMVDSLCNVIFGFILLAVTGRKPIAPKGFIGHSGTAAITCSHKAASGFLYPLDKGLIYIYKPPIYLR